MKRVAIVQSNYVPWRGYFDLISSVDEFILLDDVQYTKQDWRNRNRINTENGVVWLTIPVHGADSSMLSEVNRAFLERICAELGVTTPLISSSRYAVSGTKSRRLLDLCLAAGADEYLSGPAARSYLDEGLFERGGVSVRWFEYPEYPAYPQLYPPFEPRLSILDLLLNVGAESPRHLRTPAEPMAPTTLAD